MKRLALLVLVLFSSLAIAQAPTRVRGTITSLDGDVLSVKSREGKDLKIHLVSNVGVTTAKTTTLDELKGKYVGVTAIDKGGKITAVEVHAIPPQAKPGHFSWDLQPGSTMTNANLDGIAQVSGGNEITLNYQGGSQKILVPPGTPIVAFDPGSRADLKPGEWIWTNARQEADGKIVAERLNVSKDGVKPPH
ncbi:MAG TPA: hypothetical protein VLF65_21820 [Burkholderiales bacterium]|jgi:hypothetical protein|nr:hypothetical protein [Burkholderiales bacterium]